MLKRIAGLYFATLAVVVIVGMLTMIVSYVFGMRVESLSRNQIIVLIALVVALPVVFDVVDTKYGPRVTRRFGYASSFIAGVMLTTSTQSPWRFVLAALFFYAGGQDLLKMRRRKSSRP